MTQPDLVRPIDAPSRGSERCRTVCFGARLGGVDFGGRAAIRTEYPRLGTGFGVGTSWD